MDVVARSMKDRGDVSRWLVSFATIGAVLAGCSASDQAAPSSPIDSAPLAPTVEPMEPAEDGESANAQSTDPEAADADADAAAIDGSLPVCDPLLPETWSIVVADIERTAQVYPAFAPEPSPALVLFHGPGGTASGIATETRLVEVAGGAGVHLIAPQAAGTPAVWNLGDPAADTAFVDALLAELAANPCVDSERIGLAGFSAGAGWTGDYGCAHADKVALLLMASGVPGNSCDPAADIDILIAHGTDDGAVAFDGGDVVVGDSTVRLDPVPESALLWAQQAECATERDLRALDDDVTTLTTWTGCGRDSRVVFQVVEGMGHAWAGASVDGGELNPGCIAVHLLARTSDAVGACL